MKASEQIIAYLDAPIGEDRYHRTALDNMRLGDVTTEQLQHYLACRRQLEEHKDEETVFEEIMRLERQADDETKDAWDRLGLAGLLADEAFRGDIDREILFNVASGMLASGWRVEQVAYALGTLGAP